MWYQHTNNDLILTLHIQPGAKHSELAGLHGDALKIRLAAPPVEGRANDALLRFIADIFAVPLRDVELLRGAQSRSKTVKIKNVTALPDTLRDL
jgi:uncharacterized protein (TIGR00251 family)